MIQEITDKELKSKICTDILHKLNEWFAYEEPIIEYSQRCADLPFYAAIIGNQPVGFISVKQNTPYAAEIYVTGIYKEHHRKGIGKELIKEAENYCINAGIEYLSVKTVGDSSPDKYYAKTRAFYMAAGFRPINVFPEHWDEYNPCLIMVKYLK